MLRSLGSVAALLLASPVLAQQLSITPGPDAHAPVVAEVFSSDASARGPVVLAGGSMRLLSGSTVRAGAHAARVRLVRGGEVRVCPETGVAVNSSGSRELMLSFSAGALEAQYSLPASDVILTPDFRIVLAGPGELRVVLAADYKGNACVQTLDGNTASISISELMGSGTYHMKPAEQVYFRNGSVAEATSQPSMTCGCPGHGPVEREMERAAAPAPSAPPPPVAEPISAATLPVTMPGAVPEELRPVPAEPVSAASLPVSKSNDVHVQVEVPLVFSASEAEPAPEPSAVAELKPLQVPALFNPLLKNEVSQPPEPQAATKEKKRRGFFSRIGGFFAAMFRGK
jgi:hypothetical protein